MESSGTYDAGAGDRDHESPAKLFVGVVLQTADLCKSDGGSRVLAELVSLVRTRHRAEWRAEFDRFAAEAVRKRVPVRELPARLKERFPRAERETPQPAGYEFIHVDWSQWSGPVRIECRPPSLCGETTRELLSAIEQIARIQKPQFAIFDFASAVRVQPECVPALWYIAAFAAQEGVTLRMVAGRFLPKLERMLPDCGMLVATMRECEGQYDTWTREAREGGGQSVTPEL